MEPEQIPQLIAEIALADSRIRRTDEMEQVAQISMWAGILADVPYGFAVTAVHKHYATSQWPILPANIATRWQAVVRDRMARDVDPAPPVDPDNESAYRHALAARRRAVATGQVRPVEQKMLTGPAAEDVQRRMAELGDYLPTSVREALAPYRPAAAARIVAIRTGQPDAYAVPCPVETCRADVRFPCTSTRRNGGRRTLKVAHPSRVDAAAARDRAAAS
ncbi:zinc finger domain-containing protein [Streptomyces sp. NPDC001493]